MEDVKDSETETNCHPKELMRRWSVTEEQCRLHSTEKEVSA